MRVISHTYKTTLLLGNFFLRVKYKYVGNATVAWSHVGNATVVPFVTGWVIAYVDITLCVGVGCVILQIERTRRVGGTNTRGVSSSARS